MMDKDLPSPRRYNDRSENRIDRRERNYTPNSHKPGAYVDKSKKSPYEDRRNERSERHYDDSKAIEPQKPSIKEKMFDILDNGDLSDGERLIGLGLLQLGNKAEPLIKGFERLSIAIETFSKAVQEAASSEQK